jgi:hypothetical protein
MEKWEIFSQTLTSLLDRQTSKFSLYLLSQIFSIFIKLHTYLSLYKRDNVARTVDITRF